MQVTQVISRLWTLPGLQMERELHSGHMKVRDMIYIMEGDGTNQEKVSSNRCSHFTPAPSPDGSKIAFTLACG